MNPVVSGKTRERKGSDMAEHKHGEMDISAHEETFHGFVRFMTRAVIVIFAILIFMAIFTS